MRILHLLKSNKYSGAENVVLTIMDVCSDMDMVYASPDGSIREVVESRGHEFYPLNRPTIREVKKAIRELHPDVIHAHDFTMASTAAWAAGDIPVVAHLHNNPPWLKKICPRSVVFAFALSRIRQVISVSKAVEDEYIFRGLMKNKNTVIGNIVDAEAVRQKAQEKSWIDTSFPEALELRRLRKRNEQLKIEHAKAVEIVVQGLKDRTKAVDLVYLGRMLLPKNPLEFCKIVCEVKRLFPNITARMIGDGELMTQVKEYICSHELEDIIELVGFQSNPYPYLNAGKIMVMPSTWEGFGLAAVEGMCLGKPVVCSGVGGLNDIVDSTCGAKCSSMEEYAHAIIELLQDDVRYTSAAANAVLRSKRYVDMKKYADEIRKTYEVATER